MSRPLALALFIGIALSIVGGFHYLIWARLVRDPNLPPWAYRSLTLLVVLLFASLPLAFWLSQVLPPDRGRLLLLVLWSWFGLMFLFVVMIGLSDGARLAAAAFRYLFTERGPVDPERRLTLARVLAGSIAATGLLLGAVGAHDALTRLAVKRVRVRLARLPASLNGLRMVQLSDLHVGPTLRRAFVEAVVSRTNALSPDLIVITGDLVDGSVERLASMIEPIKELRARHGVYFVTGNHDFYSGAEVWCAELTRLGIRVLRNERVSIGGDGGSFDLAGIDDPTGTGMGGGPDLERALRGRDPSRELVLLAHQPRAVHQAARLGVGLQLSGHTHGGQLWPWRWFVFLQQPVVAGLASIKKTQIYVSSGTGFWGPPMRLGVPAEITELTLEAGPGLV